MRAVLGGVSISYTDRGHGPPVLLVHGFPLDRNVWTRQIDELSKGFRVIAPDVRGHGKTSSPPGTYTMDALAGDLLGLMDVLSVPRFAVVGHSMGGYILFAMARTAMRRLAGAALVASRATADTPEARRTRESTAQRVLAEGTGFLAETMPDRLLAEGVAEDLSATVREIITAANPLGVAGALRGMADRADSTALLPQLAMPVWVAAGRQDKIVPPAESESMAAAVPGAMLAWYEKSGHMPMIEEPDAFTGDLAGFLGGLKV